MTSNMYRLPELERAVSEALDHLCDDRGGHLPQAAVAWKARRGLAGSSGHALARTPTEGPLVVSEGSKRA